MPRDRVLALILAGGRGSRLEPLTRERSKPAVPFGGRYRIVDFVLSNFVNSRHPLALRARPVHVAVADRAPAHGLADERPGARPLHRRRAAADADRRGVVPRQRGRGAPEPEPDRRLRPRPGGRLRRGPHLPDGREPDGGVPPGARAPTSRWRRARCRVAEASSFGDARRRRERPGRRLRREAGGAAGHAGRPEPGARVDGELPVLAPGARGRAPRGRPPAAPTTTSARRIIPALVPTARVFAYDFQGNEVPGHQAVRGAGVLARRGDARGVLARAHGPAGGDARASTSTTGAGRSTRAGTTGRRRGSSAASSRTPRSARAPSCVRATIRNSILGRGVWVNEGAVIEDSIVMDFTSVGKGAHLRRAIVDRYNIIPAGQQLGLDPAADRRALPGRPVGPRRRPARRAARFPLEHRGALRSPRPPGQGPRRLATRPERRSPLAWPQKLPIARASVSARSVSSRYRRLARYANVARKAATFTRRARSITGSIEGAWGFRIVAGWWSVRHHSTEKWMIGTSSAPTMPSTAA